MATATARRHSQMPENTWRLAEPLLPGRRVNSRPEIHVIVLTEPAENKPGLWNFEYLYGTAGG